MKTLTHTQREVLAFVAQHIRERGISPTIREIGDAMCWSSTNTVSTHLRALEKKGYLRRLHKRGRGLVLVERPRPVDERIAQVREQIAALEAELARLLAEDAAGD